RHQRWRGAGVFLLKQLWHRLVRRNPQVAHHGADRLPEMRPELPPQRQLLADPCAIADVRYWESTLQNPRFVSQQPSAVGKRESDTQPIRLQPHSPYLPEVFTASSLVGEHLEYPPPVRQHEFAIRSERVVESLQVSGALGHELS